MDTQTTKASLLAEMVRKRLNQLGVSRRQFCMANEISRQTLYEIEHQGKTNLMPTTLAAIDQGLHWVPGTAARYASGDSTVGNNREAYDLIHEYMHRIVRGASIT
jgi:DNA-binding XRE family transcriptional regulator